MAIMTELIPGTSLTYAELIRYAMNARENSYSPYSRFAVGAALVTSSGKVYTGCNIENAAFSPTNCAERTAAFKAVSEGERDFLAIAICGGPADNDVTDYCHPCGVCRQVLCEFSMPEKFIVISAISEEKYKAATLDKLLPDYFKL